jgi:hypothetical protein
MGDAKRTVRINRVFAISKLSRSQYFQFNRCIWGYRATLDIFAHRPIFAPPLPLTAHVY